MRFSVSVRAADSLRRSPAVVALPVAAGEGDDDAAPLPVAWSPSDPVTAEVTHLLRDRHHPGRAGVVHHLPRPAREPGHVLLYGVGPGVTEAGASAAGDGPAQAWREAGAALYRAAAERGPALAVALPHPADGAVAGELALGAWLAAYRFEPPGRGSRPRKEPPALRAITVVTDATVAAAAAAAVARAEVLAGAVALARDLTNTASARKSPAWFADRIVAAAARRAGVSVKVLDRAGLVDAGFGGLLAVGGGSPRPPVLVELSWRPRGARTHVVLAGKGICFDTGGISLKPLDGMRLMRKDMGGAAAACAAVLAAADLALPVRVTALAPLAENLVSGSSMRPGDVIRHYGGVTSEVLDTDAEGRLVLGDALAYAARRLRPDWLIDLATLTGASHVALGKRTAALFCGSPELAESLRAAGARAGEPVWPLPMPDDYLGLLHSDVADLANIGRPAQAGSVIAAQYLRELTGDCRDRWAHIDMSGPSWSDRDDGPLVKGATGWGVRLLVGFLTTLAS